MATNHVRFALAPRRFHLVAGHGSRRVHIGERVLRFFHERMRRRIAANIAKLSGAIALRHGDKRAAVNAALQCFD